MTATVNLAPLAKLRFVDNNGVPLAGGKLFTYAVGSTTKQPTYTDASGATPNPNPILLDSRGEAGIWFDQTLAYKVTLAPAADSDPPTNPIWTVDNIPAGSNQVNTFIALLSAGTGGASIGVQQVGTGSVVRTVQAELRDIFKPTQFGALGNGAADDGPAQQAAVTALPSRGKLAWTSASVSYKTLETVNFSGKAGSIFDFQNAFIDASGIATPQDALYFKGISEAVVRNVFLVGNKTNVTNGMNFDADGSNLTIHAQIDQLHVSGCNVAVKFGSTGTFQFSDNNVGHVYGTDSNIGIYCTGNNTLAMFYEHLEAFNNSNIGVLFEQGNGTVGYLQGAHNQTNFFFGKTSGANHSNLNRWDILGGYSEEAITNEVFIGSAACSDTNPFHETITFRNYRCTPFTSTNLVNFIQWNLNGDLVLEDCTFTSGTQGPQIAIACNNTYRKGRVLIRRGVWDMDPPGSAVPPITYSLTDPSQVVDIEDVRCNNTLTAWQNAGSVNQGTMIRGIDTRKVREFESALLALPGLIGAWNLRDLPSGTCRSIVTSAPNLTLSVSAQQYDLWQDDGLVGFYRYGGNTSKTLSATSSKFAVGALTFGAILRCNPTGVDETNFTSLGDAIGSGAGLGMRLGIGNTGGAFVRCQIGAFTAQAVPDNGFDPHLVIGTYTPSTSLIVYAINLRTGNVVTTSNTTSIPATGALTWTNAISMRNDLCVRGFPFVYSGALTAAQVQALQQSALHLVDSWRLA